MDGELNSKYRVPVTYLAAFGVSEKKAAAAGALFFKETFVQSVAVTLNKLERHMAQVADRVIRDQTLSSAEKMARFQLMCLTRLGKETDRLLDPDEHDIEVWRQCYDTWDFAGTPDEKRVTMMPQAIVPVHPLKAIINKIRKNNINRQDEEKRV